MYLLHKRKVFVRGMQKGSEVVQGEKLIGRATDTADVNFINFANNTFLVSFFRDKAKIATQLVERATSRQMSLQVIKIRCKFITL